MHGTSVGCNFLVDGTREVPKSSTSTNSSRYSDISTQAKRGSTLHRYCIERYWNNQIDLSLYRLLRSNSCRRLRDEPEALFRRHWKKLSRKELLRWDTHSGEKDRSKKEMSTNMRRAKQDSRRKWNKLLKFIKKRESERYNDALEEWSRWKQDWDGRTWAEEEHHSSSGKI